MNAAMNALKRFCAAPSALIALVVLVLIALAALGAPWLAPQNPYDIGALDLLDARQRPGTPAEAGHLVYWLGTDGQGRDILSAILYGLRISLGIGAGASLAALVAGAAIGLTVGYRGGVLDGVVMRVVDLQLAFPSILLALALLAFLRPGLANIALALVAVQWAYYARTARAAALAERAKEYVRAAEAIGAGTVRIVFRHLLPNCAAPLAIVAALQVAAAIMLEATLSFLGLGAPVTEPSLGLLVANGFQYLLSGSYWISFFPGVALCVTLAAINLVADRLREVLFPAGVAK